MSFLCARIRAEHGDPWSFQRTAQSCTSMKTSGCFYSRIIPNGTRNVANLIGNNEEKWQILSALIRDCSRLRCM